MHIHRYKATEQVPAALQLVIDHTVSVGSYVAVLDEHDSPRYHLAQVIDTREREDSLIILSNVGLTDRARINVTSRNALERFPQTHHVVGRTWFLNR